MATAASDRRLDETGLKTAAGLTIVLLLLAFVLNSWILVALVAAAQLLGGVGAPFAPYRLIYTYIVRPSGIVKPKIVVDNPEPHRFALLVGGLCNAAATLALLVGASTLGWALVWVVIALANLNFWLNFCVGCLMYYQLNRLGLPGFDRSPLVK